MIRGRSTLVHQHAGRGQDVNNKNRQCTVQKTQDVGLHFVHYTHGVVMGICQNNRVHTGRRTDWSAHGLMAGLNALYQFSHRGHKTIGVKGVVFEFVCIMSGEQ